MHVTNPDQRHGISSNSLEGYQKKIGEDSYSYVAISSFCLWLSCLTYAKKISHYRLNLTTGSIFTWNTDLGDLWCHNRAHTSPTVCFLACHSVAYLRQIPVLQPFPSFPLSSLVQFFFFRTHTVKPVASNNLEVFWKVTDLSFLFSYVWQPVSLKTSCNHKSFISNISAIYLISLFMLFWISLLPFCMSRHISNM